MLKNIKYAVVAASIFGANAGFANSNQARTEELKQKIYTLAKAFEGKGDPDQSKQKQIEPFVKELIQLNPMPPIKDRIQILAGAWKQVWGPYEYRNDDGSVDPKLGVKEIYQVVFADGYYYPNGDKSHEQIGLLRGEFKLDSKDANGLRVKFTRYPGVEPRPTGIDIWDLAPLAERGRLENQITIVPTWIVKTFFRGGKLEEVYTDQDTRILYGSSNKSGSRRSLYIMTRVN